MEKQINEGEMNTRRWKREKEKKDGKVDGKWRDGTGGDVK